MCIVVKLLVMRMRACGCPSARICVCVCACLPMNTLLILENIMCVSVREKSIDRIILHGVSCGHNSVESLDLLVYVLDFGKKARTLRTYPFPPPLWYTLVLTLHRISDRTNIRSFQIHSQRRIIQTYISIRL